MTVPFSFRKNQSHSSVRKGTESVVTNNEISTNSLTVIAENNNPVFDVNQALSVLKVCTFNWFDLGLRIK